jgi:hypothetical protein
LSIGSLRVGIRAHAIPSQTDRVAIVFTCQHCEAVPELVVDGGAQVSIVRHTLGCPTLCAVLGDGRACDCADLQQAKLTAGTPAFDD